MADRGRSRGPPIGGAGGGRGSGRGSPAVGHGFQEEQRGRRPTQDHPGPRSGSGPPSQRAASRSPTRGSTELVRSPVQRPATQGVAHADAMIDAQLAQPYRSIEERYGLPRNVDLPAEAYNRFHQVSQALLLLFSSVSTQPCLFSCSRSRLGLSAVSASSAQDHIR